ncbi:hypothetical protein GCM10027360_17770 [Amycolatopsis echigonensis]
MPRMTWKFPNALETFRTSIECVRSAGPARRWPLRVWVRGGASAVFDVDTEFSSRDEGAAC